MASRRARRPRRNPSDRDLRRLAREAAFDPDAADRLRGELYRAQEIGQRYMLPARISYSTWHFAFAESVIWARIENLEGSLADLPFQIMYSVIAQSLIDQSHDPEAYEWILEDWEWFSDIEPLSTRYEILAAGEPSACQFRAALEDLAPNPQRRENVNRFLGLVEELDLRQEARWAGYLRNPPYYHSSCAELKPNQRLRPKPWDDLTPHKQFVERVFEEERPAGMPSRIRSVFVSPSPGQYMPRCPAGEAGIYEVRTKGPVHKFDMDHFNDAGGHISGLASSAPYMRSVRIDDPRDVALYEPGVREAARRYWKGWKEYDWIDSDCADPDFDDPDCEFERELARHHNKNLELLTEEPVYVKRKYRRNPSPEDRELELRRRAAAGDVDAEEALERELRRRRSTGAIAAYQNAWSNILDGDAEAVREALGTGTRARTRRGLEEDFLHWRPELTAAYSSTLDPEIYRYFESAVLSILESPYIPPEVGPHRLNGMNISVRPDRYPPRPGASLEIHIEAYLDISGLDLSDNDIELIAGELDAQVNLSNEELADLASASISAEFEAEYFETDFEVEGEEESGEPSDLVIKFSAPLGLQHLFWAYDVPSSFVEDLK